ncbi:zinc finger protein [Echinococcus multilocularis]|uniref:Zinc finger protein n=1 Tax=Echinococcus multilocularis TaxID=6211 RepID=A0A068YHP4_ECHMU|nr:zinc finger protein [Echinococcus multilocularis]
MKYDFSIAHILKLSPTTQVFPKLSSSNTKDETIYNCGSRHSKSFDMASILSSSSSAAAVNSSSISSTNSKDRFDASSILQLECGCSEKFLLADWSTLPAVQSLTTSCGSSVNRMETLPPLCSPPINYGTILPPQIQPYSLPLQPGGIYLETSNYLSWCNYLLSETSFNTLSPVTNTSIVNAPDNALNFSSIKVVEYTTNGERNDSVSCITSTSEVKDVGVDEEELPKWKCQECGKMYNSSACLRMHKRSHLHQWRCHFCDKAFSRKWLLEGHERTHTGEKPFICPVCRRGFADRSNMRMHMQTHMAEKRCRCPHCLRSFTRRSLLIRHMEKCPFSTTAAAAVTNDAPTTSTLNRA